MTVQVVLLLGLGTYALRLLGPLLKGRIRFSDEAERLMSVAAMVLLGAFVATSAVIEDGGFAGVARFAGVAVGGLLAWFRAPFVVVVVAAAGITAAVRALGVA
ncbi:AzlD domain-containing protein [Allosaccharopolyspora coralli]|uniref:AzlD domain-containing protein n=1 Tax=Allosaccharopolyspora coralli TaxID=2665642 RepID=A0A5Q3Q864_9PSEU|nr:AzlD domain-containing protein [Allosaccharopolyspora coralli]QGK69626.1 AzlD domain-containing protein [Allosaccharopolyspora coralli]